MTLVVLVQGEWVLSRVPDEKKKVRDMSPSDVVASFTHVTCFIVCLIASSERSAFIKKMVRHVCMYYHCIFHSCSP